MQFSRKHLNFGIVKVTEGIHFIFRLTWFTLECNPVGMYEQTSKDKPERKVSIKYRCEQKMGTKKSWSYLKEDERLWPTTWQLQFKRTRGEKNALPSHSDLNDQNLFHSTIDAPPGVPGVSKNPDNQTEVHSGELER